VSVTIDIAGLAPERIVFEISPLAELGVALHALAEPGHHPGLHGWATATAAGLKPDLADRLHEADFLWRSTFSDVFMPFAGLPLGGGGARTGATLAEELDQLDRLDETRFVSAALEFTCSSAYDIGGPVRRERALELAATRGPKQLDFTRRLLDDPSSVRAWVRRLFEDCDHAFFADTWRRVSTQLAADARHKSELLRHKGLAEALHAVSPALAVDEDRTRISADKLAEGRTTAVDPAVGAGLSLVPSSFGWPHLMVLHAPGWRPVIHYPVGSPALPGPAPVELLKLRMEALAHPMRMRLCRNLARAPFTTSELADAYGITAPEVSRHLAVLKKAGLISTQRRGRYVLHQLDVTAVARLGSDFLETVLR
jgi:DNA-binding transcriptional ArsR family regulator